MGIILFIINIILYLCLIGLIYFRITDKSPSIFQKISNPKYNSRVYISISDMKEEINNSKNDISTIENLKIALKKRRKFWVIFFVAVFLVLLKIVLNFESGYTN